MEVDAGTEAEYQCRTLESAQDSFRPVPEVSEVCVKTLHHTAPHASSVFGFCKLSACCFFSPYPHGISALASSISILTKKIKRSQTLLFALFYLLAQRKGRIIFSWVGAKSACIVVFIAEAVEQGRYGQDAPEAGWK